MICVEDIFETRLDSAKDQGTLSKITKSATSGVTREKLGNLLENFKTDLLDTFSLELDTLQFKKKQEDENKILSIFCPKCREKHPLRECPLAAIKICAICRGDRPIEQCPAIPGLEAVYEGENQATEQLSTLAPRRPWKPRALGMTSNPASQFTSYFPSQPYAPQCLDPTMPWQG